ncbi:ImmA/IrrE family metallo-endopeptidase [Curtobacterium sp. MCSS17_015]|nr:ImmA/IrrE family metallo-endopeptidase [Curtobacterium sp. MCSS17_015]WIB25399.1 ImmA/IrrE family metallo-endopeptidase [Curtobacterium sp. MCSS17_015]
MHIDDANGFYDAEQRVVKVDISSTPNEKRSVVAHELGHVHHGHTCGDGRDGACLRRLPPSALD